MKVVIFGLSKSGTTALFYKIKHSLPDDTVCLFEPQAFASKTIKMRGSRAILPARLRRREPDVLAKVLPFRRKDPVYAESFLSFEKQILIVRDPRDRLISQLLYGTWHSNFYHHDHKVSAFLEVLEQKESDPISVPLKTILSTFSELNGEPFSVDDWAASYRHHSILRPLSFHDEHRDLFLYKYEDMVDQRFGSLEEYLTFKLKGEGAVAREWRRVVRTKGYGNWRDWLTTADIDFLRPLLKPFLERYYPGADWELNMSPTIPAKYASKYVERVVNDRRTSEGIPTLNYSVVD